jgi:hypothetical protein
MEPEGDAHRSADRTEIEDMNITDALRDYFSPH